MSPKTTTKTKTTRWWWIRHAPVDNPERRLYGQSDIDAIVSDTDDFKQLAKHLPSDGVWVASHLKRTHQTAQAIIPHFKARGHNAPELLTHPELAEQNFGDWQGMTYNELKAHLGDGFDDFWKAPARAQPPAGESFDAVINRVQCITDQLNRTHEGSDIIAFAHGGSIRAALAVALGLDPDAALNFQIDTLSLTRIDHILPGDNPPSGSVQPWRIGVVNHSPTPGVPKIMHPRG